MTKTAQRQMAKGKAFNAIKSIYRLKSNFHYSNYYEEDGSYAEQREQAVSTIMGNYFKELSEINSKQVESKK